MTNDQIKSAELEALFERIRNKLISGRDDVAKQLGYECINMMRLLSRTPSHGRVSDSDVMHLARILEEWDMKDPPNDWTGHSYEDIARDALIRLGISTPPETVAAPIPVEGDVEAIQADRDLFISLRGFAEDDALARMVNRGLAYTAEVQEIARHRLTFSRGVEQEAAALRIGWWNDMIGRGVLQDAAIAKIKAALSTIEEPRG